jgi:DNA transposition AAA+ family ATPase
MQINIVDSIMGAGKTTAAINYINQSSEEKKFMYVTPYLDEVERIIKQCPSKHFKQPEKFNDKASKLLSLKNLLNKGYNIATTHVLQRYR